MLRVLAKLQIAKFDFLFHLYNLFVKMNNNTTAKSMNKSGYKSLPKAVPRSAQFEGTLPSDLKIENDRLTTQLEALQLKLTI